MSVATGAPTAQTAGAFAGDVHGTSPAGLVLSVVGATMGDMPPVVADAPFVGRAEHLDRLARLLDGAVDGHPAAVLVGGDAGVGKTRLVGELEALARRRGFLVGTGRCVDLGAGGLPYLPFVDALRSLARAGGTVSDVVDRATADAPVLLHLVGRGADGRRLEEADRLPLFDAVAALLARVSDEAAPLLLVLEDLHWADASTRDLLRFVLSRPGAERLLVVVTVRTDDLHRRHPVRPLLAELVRLPGVERLDLAPFDAAELSRLLATAGGDVPATVVADIARRSGGNAFFALELLASAGAGLDALPWTLTEVLLTRVEQLSPTALEVVRAASVAGRCVADRMLRHVVADAVAGGQGGLDAALREALDRHVLVADDPDRYSFRHALLQEAVYADLLPGERVRLHAAYARLLADGLGEYGAGTNGAEGGDGGGGSHADLAEHALRSHDNATALAASWAAARQARDRLAPLDALEHAETALSLWDAVPADRRPADGDHTDLLLLAANVAGQGGDRTRATALAAAARDEALADGDPLQVAHARRHLARHFYARDMLEECIREAELAREVLLTRPPTADLVWATATLANATAAHDQPVRTAELAREALGWARDLGLAAAEADLLVTLSLVRTASADGVDGAAGDEEDDGDLLGSATRRLLHARDRALAAGEPAIELRALWNLGMTHHEVDDLPGAVAYYRQVEERAARTGLGASLYAVEVRLSLMEVLFRLGEWDDVLVTGRAEGLRLGRRDRTSLEVARLRVTAERSPQDIAAAVARLRALARTDDQALSSWADVSMHIHEATAALWCGRPGEVVEHVRAALDRLAAEDDALHLVGIRVAAQGLAALAALAAEGGTDEATADHLLAHAEEVVARARPMRGRTIGPEARAWLARARLGHARVRRAGHPDVVDAPVLRDVLGLVAGQPYEEAVTRYRLAESLVAGGDRPAAGEAARKAFTIAVPLGARPLRDALEALGRRARLDLGAGVTAADGPLTPREAEVLRLVADGLTNRAIGERLFISEKTASVHVSNILGKLGASGRTEAVAIAGRRGLLPDG